MFDNFTSVPHTDDEVRNTIDIFTQIYERISAVIDTSKYRINWNTDYALSGIVYLLAAVTSIGIKESHDKFRLYYNDNNQYRFKNIFTQDTEKHGIIINKEASTHFNENDYYGAIYLTNAENFLKQSPHHYLRIFTGPYNHQLYVWTNKSISPENLYKLFALEASISERNNKLADDFINNLIAKNAEGARKALEDFMNSDAIKDMEFEKFRKCLSNSNSTRISTLEDFIYNRRTSIKNYEDTISRLAAEIREKSLELIFLKSLDITEDQKLFFKHLNKIPYIIHFEANENGYIKLWYEAPLIYFAEYPAEKILNASYITDFQKSVIKAIIGRKYELWTKCTLQFDTRDFAVDNASGRTDGSPHLLPHPHIARYGCFGNHRQAIAESAETGDYIGAIEQVTQAVLNLNFYDSCVIDSMLAKLYEQRSSLNTWKCVETGEMLTTSEVLERNDYYEETQSID